MNTKKSELIETGRQWLEHAPPATDGPEDLAGYTGAINVCSSCASRILGRGCNLRMFASTPVWDVNGFGELKKFECDLCECVQVGTPS